jgi:hypothetical protein
LKTIVRVNAVSWACYADPTKSIVLQLPQKGLVLGLVIVHSQDFGQRIWVMDLKHLTVWHPRNSVLEPLPLSLVEHHMELHWELKMVLFHDHIVYKMLM